MQSGTALGTGLQLVQLKFIVASETRLGLELIAPRGVCP
jgi:hypothetical protein